MNGALTSFALRIKRMVVSLSTVASRYARRQFCIKIASRIKSLMVCGYRIMYSGVRSCHWYSRLRFDTLKRRLYSSFIVRYQTISFASLRSDIGFSLSIYLSYIGSCITRVFMCQLIDSLPVQIRLKQVMKPFQTDKGKKTVRDITSCWLKMQESEIIYLFLFYKLDLL